ncbi:MAG TPA: Fic family protein [Puia sp.]|nr:Fic family protein [Puia sp.]
MKKIEHPPTLYAYFKGNNNAEKLAELVTNHEVSSLVNQINETYKFWDKVKYIPPPKGFTPTDIWIAAKFKRRSSPYSVTIGKHHFTWFLNSQLQELLHLFDLHIGGSLEASSLIPREEKHKYLINSIMEEAIASSQIEGAVTTRKRAKEMLRKSTPPKTKSEQMIFNNYVTIQKILEIKDEDLSFKRILEIHKLISRDTLADKADEGCFRGSDDVNVVDAVTGNIVYAPPPSVELEALMNELCIFFNTESHSPFVHPIIKACIIHFMIGYVHPFVDGNGRTARALFYWYLLKKGYWLTEYLSISKLILRSKAQYAKAYLYTEIDENDLTYFIKYKLRTMKLAFESLREYIGRKIAEKKKLTDFVRLPGINDRQALILKWYSEEPSMVLTVKELQNRSGVSNQTARNDLQGLVAVQLLEHIKLNGKTDAFVKGGKFDALIERMIES